MYEIGCTLHSPIPTSSYEALHLPYFPRRQAHDAHEARAPKRRSSNPCKGFPLNPCMHLPRDPCKDFLTTPPMGLLIAPSQPTQGLPRYNQQNIFVYLPPRKQYPHPKVLVVLTQTSVAVWKSRNQQRPTSNEVRVSRSCSGYWLLSL